MQSGEGGRLAHRPRSGPLVTANASRFGMSPGEPPVLDQPRGGTGDQPELVADLVQPVDVRDQVDVRIQQSNVLPIRPSGSGITHLVGLLASDLVVPLVIGDATSLTETGYVGDDVESLLSAAPGEARRLPSTPIADSDSISGVSRIPSKPSNASNISFGSSR